MMTIAAFPSGGSNRGRSPAAMEANDPRHFTAEDIEVLTYTLLGEARGEGPIGMLGVANVIRNRADSGFYPSDPVAVVSWDRQPWQFTTNGPEGVGNQTSTRREVQPGSPLYQQAERIVRQAIVADEPTVPDITGRAINYHADYVSPSWSAGATTQWGTVTVGDHIFYARRPVPPLDIPSVASLLDVDVPPMPMRPMGQTEPGNLLLTARPIVRNRDGSVNTLLSMSFEEDGREILIPRVSQDAKVMTPDEAVAEYRRTGQHLGKFTSPETATRFADQLHIGQDRMFRGMTGPRRDPRTTKSAGRRLDELREEQRTQAHRRSFVRFALEDAPVEAQAAPMTDREKAYEKAKQELARLLTTPKVEFALDPFSDFEEPASSRTVAPGAGVSRTQQEAMREVRSAAATRLAAPGANLTISQRQAMAAASRTAAVTIEFERGGAGQVPQGAASPVPQGTAAGVPQDTIVATEPGSETPSRVTAEGLNVYTRKLYTVDADGNPIIVDAPAASSIQLGSGPNGRKLAATERLALIRVAATQRDAAARRRANLAKETTPSGGTGRGRPAQSGFASASDPTQPAGSIVAGKSVARLFAAPGLPLRPDLQQPSLLGRVPDQIAEIMRQRAATTSDFVDSSSSAPIPAIPSAELVRRRTPVAPTPAARLRRVTTIGEPPKLSDLITFRSVPYGGRSSEEMLEGTGYEKLGALLDGMPSTPSSAAPVPAERIQRAPSSISPDTAAPKPAPAAQRPPPKVTTQTVAPQPRTIPKTIRVRNPEYGKAIVKPVSADQTVITDRFGIPTGEIGTRNAPPGPRTRPNVPEFIDQTIHVRNPNYLDITVGGGVRPTVIGPRPAAISRRPAAAIKPKSAGIYYTPDTQHQYGSGGSSYGSDPGQSTAGLSPGDRVYSAETNSWGLK